MRDSREKGAGMRDQDPPSRPCPRDGHLSYEDPQPQTTDKQRITNLCWRGGHPISLSKGGVQRALSKLTKIN